MQLLNLKELEGSYMKNIILASNNKNKILQIKQILPDCNILTLDDIGFEEDIVEDGNSFLENALIKANAVRKFLNHSDIKYPILAEDSGLCVNALGGAPGIYSARYAGGHGNDKANRKKLLDNLKDKTDRSAYYYAIEVLMDCDGTYKVGEGKVDGIILDYEGKENNFGYDPIFYSTELNKIFSECSSEERNLVSHRARALKQLFSLDY